MKTGRHETQAHGAHWLPLLSPHRRNSWRSTQWWQNSPEQCLFLVMLSRKVGRLWLQETRRCLWTAPPFLWALFPSRLNTKQKPKPSAHEHGGYIDCKCGHHKCETPDEARNSGIIHRNSACFWSCCHAKWDDFDCKKPGTVCFPSSNHFHLCDFVSTLVSTETCDAWTYGTHWVRLLSPQRWYIGQITQKWQGALEWLLFLVMLPCKMGRLHLQTNNPSLKHTTIDNQRSP